jgi:hypothetical protein
MLQQLSGVEFAKRNGRHRPLPALADSRGRSAGRAKLGLGNEVDARQLRALRRSTRNV